MGCSSDSEGGAPEASMCVSKPLAVTLMGPTAAGKTDLAISLVDALDGEIISVDSALVYRGMDIGSAKPSAEELKRAPHRLIDIRDPSEPYSVADFCRDARREMNDICRSGKTPILVGGTMLYFKGLLEGLSPMPSADEKVRLEIEREAQEKGWPYIHAQLAEVDPESAAKIHPNHSQRVGRALEVYRISGKPMSAFHEASDGGLIDTFNWQQFAIAPRDRALLHARIEKRFDLMLAQGLLSEVKSLMERGDLHKDLPAIRAVGYRQAWEHLSDEYDAQEMRAKGVAATRQLAKRQLTWLRRWPDVHWVETQDEQGNLRSNDDLRAIVLKIMGKSIV